MQYRYAFVLLAAAACDPSAAVPELDADSDPTTITAAAGSGGSAAAPVIKPAAGSGGSGGARAGSGGARAGSGGAGGSTAAGSGGAGEVGSLAAGSGGAGGAGEAGEAGSLAAGSGGAGGAGGAGGSDAERPFPWGPFCRIGKSTEGAITSPEIWGCDDVVRTGQATNVPGLVVSIKWGGNLQACSQSPYEATRVSSDGNPPPCSFGSKCTVWITGGGNAQEFPGTCR